MMSSSTNTNQPMVPTVNGGSRSRALADIQLNTILAADAQTSSDDEAPGTSEEDARAALGISIGREQTRLTSPTTPAVEKSAAIDKLGGFFDGSFEHDDHDVIHESIEEFPNSQTTGTSELPHRKYSSISPSRRISKERLPSPWRADQDAEWQTKSQPARRSSKTRSALLDGFHFSRRRASSGPENKSESWQKSIWDSLPTRPKNFSIPNPFSSAHEPANGESAPRKQPIVIEEENGRVPRPGTSMDPNVTRSSPNDWGPLSGGLRRGGSDVRPPHLRHSTSDTSLTARRTLSVVSSLGETKNWDDVHEQVNSRFKAIKDSFQDSNFRLPSISNISVANLAPDFLRERSSISSWRTSREDDNARHSRPVDPMTRQPYMSAKAAVQDAHLDKASVAHPHFNEALEQLEGDVVMLGGYRGSILRSAEPPHRQLWVPIKVGLNLRKVDLEVGIREGDDARASEKVIADGMLSHIGPVDISRRLQKRLKSCESTQTGKLRLHNYGYDWRLDPQYLSQQLVKFLESLPDNRGSKRKGATVICHSLGGLITRHAVNQRPDLFRAVVYAGVPRTCVNILGPLRNGDEVLLSSRVLTAQVNFTIRTSFALLPLNGRCFLDKDTKEEYRVDFFDPKTWLEYRLTPCIARPLPPLMAPPKPTGFAGYVASLPSIPLPGRNRAFSRDKGSGDTGKVTAAGGVAAPQMSGSGTQSKESNMAMSDKELTRTDAGADNEVQPTVRTSVTIPYEEAMEYLTRTLSNVKRFKEELAFNPVHQQNNAYPPIAVIYGKSTPTVYGARVSGREGIKRADAYDNLAFASGDGVVLARAAMAPRGYSVAKGGIVSSERGHVTLLGDLEAVGKCLNAVLEARRQGVGLGSPQ